MKSNKLQQKVCVLIFIVVANLILLVSHYTYETNKFYYIEDTNTFRWQKFMNEEEFKQLEKGMTYMDVVSVVKGRGEPLTERSFIWKDEQLMMRTYIITFQNDQLVGKFIHNKSQLNLTEQAIDK